MFRVCNGYTIQDGLIYASGDSWNKQYDAPEEIHNHFEKVVDEKSLMKFVRNFGLPGVADPMRAYLTLTKDGDPKKSSPNQVSIGLNKNEVCYVDFVSDILEEAFLMRITRQALGFEPGDQDIVVKGKIIDDYIKTIFTSDIKIGTYLRCYSFFSTRSLDDAFFTEEQRKSIAAVLVSAKISEVTEFVTYDEARGKFVNRKEYKNLISAIWYRFYTQVIKDGGKTKECPYCHSLHEGKGRSRFCPPDKYGNESPCRKAYHSKKLRDYRRDIRLIETKEDYIKLKKDNEQRKDFYKDVSDNLSERGLLYLME